MSQSAIGLALAALSALLAASAHAYLKASDDKLAFRSWTCLICAALALPFALWSGPPERETLGLLAAFVVVSAVSQFFLFRSYRISDFSLAYPVARGIVPLSMALLGVLWLGDRLSALAGGGIAAITLGIVLLALGRGMTRHGWGAALMTGTLTVGYSLLMAKGMRETSDPVNFLAWLWVGDGVLLPAALALSGKSMALSRLAGTFQASWPTALMTFVSFTALSLAMRLAPAGSVSAIRESSVLIALVLGAIMLKERIDGWRLAGAVLIVAGAIAIVLG